MAELEANLEAVAFELAETNVVSQTSKDLREELKDRFFSLVDETLTSDLATKTLSVPEGMEASEYVSKYHGDWDLHAEKDGEVVVIEKARFKPFSIVVQSFEEDEGNQVPVTVQDKKGNEALGFVVSRTIKGATPQIDYDRLKEDEEFYLRITEDPVVPPQVATTLAWVAIAKPARGVSVADGLRELEELWLKDNPQPRPIKEDIKLKDLAKLRKHYLIQPASTPVLNVRLAKEEEV